MMLTFTFPVESTTLARIGEVVRETGIKAGFNEEEIGDIQLAVDEACTNTILHGLKSDPNRNFELAVEWQRHEIVICIKERGEPFELSKVKKVDIAAPLEAREIGGLGIHFIYQLMDEVDYRTEEDGLKVFRMVKRKKSASAC